VLVGSPAPLAPSRSFQQFSVLAFAIRTVLSKLTFLSPRSIPPKNVRRGVQTRGDDRQRDYKLANLHWTYIVRCTARRLRAVVVWCTRKTQGKRASTFVSRGEHQRSCEYSSCSCGASPLLDIRSRSYAGTRGRESAHVRDSAFFDERLEVAAPGSSPREIRSTAW